MVQERLPAVSRLVEGAGRGAAGALGGVVVVVGRGWGGRGGRDELVAEDGGGPLPTHYGRHGGPRPRRPAAPQIRPPLVVLAAAVALLAKKRKEKKRGRKREKSHLPLPPLSSSIPARNSPRNLSIRSIHSPDLSIVPCEPSVPGVPIRSSPRRRRRRSRSRSRRGRR